MSLSAIPKSLRAEVFARDMGRCQYCHLAQLGQAAVFHINHVTPRSKGGPTVISNLVLQCPHCSLRKSDKLVAVDPETGDEVRLFHPIEQNWSTHFELGGDGIIRGLTKTGRATVLALQMNEPISTTARGFQILLGLM